MVLKNIKKTFTSCYISRQNSFRQETIINQDDAKEITASNENLKNGIQRTPCETKNLYNLPSSLFEATKEDKERFKQVLIMNTLKDYMLID